MKSKISFLAIIFFFMISSYKSLQAQYNIKISVIAGGGAVLTGNANNIIGTLGQPLVGNSNDQSNLIGNGFLSLVSKVTSVVPVELTSFTANLENNQVELKWSTATETNNYGFEIERADSLRSQNSQNGNSGPEGYKKIGFVKGAGTTTKPNHYSFTDKDPLAGTSEYRLKQIDFDGTSKYSKTVEIKFIIPVTYELYQNYPNPFNPSTTIKYSLPENVHVQLKIYDVLGRVVRTLVDEKQKAGEYKIDFNSSSLASGIYFYRLVTHKYSKTSKMILLK